MKFLVVDDDAVSRKKMMKLLSTFGECDDAANGNAALEAVKTALEAWTPYHLITLDISMPDISGLKVLTAIRSMEAEQGIQDDEKSPVLMVTSHSDIETVKACVGKCEGYVIKPFNKEMITQKLRKIGMVR